MPRAENAVIDRALRRRKDVALAPLARALPDGVHPTALTAAAAVPGIGAAFAAGAGAPALAVGLWLLNRLLDGLDGALARRTGRQSDLGAYADILSDVVVYAAIPVGIAAGQGGEAAWIAAARAARDLLRQRASRGRTCRRCSSGAARAPGPAARRPR